MKGIWKDGAVLFRRDNNVKWRGGYGREPGITGIYGWGEGLMGAGRAFVKRVVNKGARRSAQADIEAQLSVEEAKRIKEEAQAIRAGTLMETYDPYEDFEPWDDWPRNDYDREHRGCV